MRENTHSSSKAVKVGDQWYDAVTGLQVPAPKPQQHTQKPASTPAKKPAPTKKTTASAHIHATPQKSQTLNRRTTKKPVVSRPATQTGTKPRVRSMDISRSPHVTKFTPAAAAQTSKVPAVTKPAPADIAPKPHKSAMKAEVKRQASVAPIKQPARKSSKEIKDEEIKKALATPTHKPKQPRTTKRHHRILVTVAASIILLVLAAWLTLANFPSLSVRIASARAGITATYPQYKPDGYRLALPVGAEDGSVTQTFNSTTNNTSFSIKQTKSSWDSTAVYDMVNDLADGQFLSVQEQGIYLYTYNSNAAWVNGGILYQITGDAPLSNEDLRSIARSL